MIRVGILSFSDGRKRVHESLEPYIRECEAKLSKMLADAGGVAVEAGRDVIYTPSLAGDMASDMAGQNLDAVIFNVSVFAFPNLSTIAARLLHLPILVFAVKNPRLPGLGGMQAAVNMIKQVGLTCRKVWGSVEDTEVQNKVLSFLRAAHAATSLEGQVYGLFGGRSIGMGSGAVNPDLWMRIFGVDVEHIDQLEIIRRAEKIEEGKVQKAVAWLEQNTRAVNYDEAKLTKETLAWQVRCYYATKDLIQERDLDFVGVKCHYELSEYYVTQCVAAAFFNDPYDWDGPKEPLVYSCEADSDGALTMQIMKLISGKPVLFMDFRHFDTEEELLTLCNCGAMATWYARRSDRPEDNLREVSLSPIIPKYAGQGCHVHFLSREGAMTFARLTRVLDHYTLTVFRGQAQSYPEEKMQESTPVWPHCFVKLPFAYDRLIEVYDNNHIHAVEGDYVAELRQFCTIKGIDCQVVE